MDGTWSAETALKTATDPQTGRDGTVTDLEAAKLLLDAWKFRQAHAWSLLTRYFLAAVLISVAPYGLNSDLTAKLSHAVLSLPIVGGLLAIAAIWLYAAEYIRAQTMSHGFRRILASYGYYQPDELRRFERVVLKPRMDNSLRASSVGNRFGEHQRDDCVVSRAATVIMLGVPLNRKLGRNAVKSSDPLFNWRTKAARNRDRE